MKDKGLLRLLAVVVAFLACYIAASVFHMELLKNILSPLCVLVAFGLVLQAFFLSITSVYRIWVWLCFALAFLSWAIADVLWIIDSTIFGRDPTQSVLISSFYLGTSVFLMVGAVIFAVKTFKRWHVIQLIVDTFAISASLIFVLWIAFFEKNQEKMGLLTQDGWVSSVSLALDFVFITGLAVWYFSIRSGKIPIHLRLIAGFIACYTLVDILYYHLLINEQYMPNAFFDIGYVASFLGIAVVSRWVPTVNLQKPGDTPAYSNIGFFHKSLFLLPAPLVIILFEGFVPSDFLVSLFIIVVHDGISNFIQSNINTNRLLQCEHTINQDLEKIIAERTKELEENLEQLDTLSKQDALTGLFNRRYFVETLDQKIQQTRPGDTLSLIFFDIDRFKIINDSHGHTVGDQIVCEIARRLQDFAAADTLLARLGGDEFVIAFQGKYSYEDMRREAQFVVKSCAEAIQIGQYSFNVTISAGVSIYPLDADSSDTLMRNSDMAMYLAKKEGYGKVVTFNDQLKQKILRKNEIEILLQKVDLDKEFQLYYQPQFSVFDKRLIGMEALLRWNSPQKGFISPVEFIPISEETNSIIPIGAWVLEKSIDQIALWNRKYKSNLKMGINVSPKQLDQIDFSVNIQNLLQDAQIPAEWIDIEITEGVAVDGEQKVAQILQRFKNSGISVSIDDFGTGYSSLSYLKVFPIQRVKIALPLIDAINLDRYDMLIVRSIILLASSIGIHCLAEGVETKMQFDLLHDLGCEQIQGFYLGRPMPPDEFEEVFLVTRKWEEKNAHQRT